MSYHHLTICERGRIEELRKLGFSFLEIGKRLERSPSTISREVKRNSCSSIYQGEVGQKQYLTRRKNSRWKGKYSLKLATVILDKLTATWSPEQISHTVTKGKASTKSIYNWFYQGKIGDGNCKLLRQKGKGRRKETRGVFVCSTTISERPKEVENRESFGHWELDTMVSSRGKSKGCLATFVERKSRLYTAFKMADRSAKTMEDTIKQLFSTLPKGAFLTTTTDRGKEFACYDNLLIDLNLPLYFADPYAPW